MALNRQVIVHKRSTVVTEGTPKAPSTGTLEKGEIAINYNDDQPSLFIETVNGDLARFVDKNYVDTKESASNKVTVINSGSTDTQYPSAKAVYDTIEDFELVAAAAINDLDKRIKTVSGNSHTHSNKTILDSIDNTKVSNWDAAYTSAHTHANKIILDSITSTKIQNWDTAESNAKAYADATASTAESNAKAYADTTASTAESNAKAYADATASTAESNAKAYADTTASTAESNAKAYADATASTAESNAKAYADNQTVNGKSGHAITLTTDDIKNNAATSSITELLISKEDKSNIITEFSSGCTDTQYPSAKLVYNTIKDNEEVVAKAINKVRQDISNKVDKVNGKELISTTAITKLEGIELGATKVTEDTVSGWGFTKNIGTITGINMNGSSKGTSGVIDLGTVITSHQDISGKEDKSNKVTSLTSACTNTQYPSAKAVYDTIVDNEEVISAALADLDERVISLSGNSHTHSNKGVLDGITGGDVLNWNTAYSSAHTHNNISVLNGITGSDVLNWNNALQDIEEGNGISVSTKANNKQTISVKVKTNEKILSASTEGLSTTLAIAYDSTNRKIQLKGINNTIISEFEASAFIKDGMLYGQQVFKASATTQTITIKGQSHTFSGLTKSHAYLAMCFSNGEVTGTTYSWDIIDVSSLIDVYTAGNGLELSNGTFSIKLNDNSDSFLTVDANGLKLSGVQSAIDDLREDISTLSGDSHTHGNKTVLDGITSNDVTNWDTAYNNNHTHSNKGILDNITSGKTINWDIAYDSAHTHTNKTILDNITNDDIDNWDLAFNNTHTHDNFEVLSSITSQKIATWDNIVDNAEVITNKITEFTTACTDTQYPSAKLVYDTLSDNELVITNKFNEIDNELLNKYTLPANGIPESDLASGVTENLHNHKVSIFDVQDGGSTPQWGYSFSDLEDAYNSGNSIFIAVYYNSGDTNRYLFPLSYYSSNEFRFTNSEPINGNLYLYSISDDNEWSVVTTPFTLHSHSNKSVLDVITNSDILNWNTAYNNSHIHANESVLNGITSAQVSKWNGDYLPLSGGTETGQVNFQSYCQFINSFGISNNKALYIGRNGAGSGAIDAFRVDDANNFCIGFGTNHDGARNNTYLDGYNIFLRSGNDWGQTLTLNSDHTSTFASGITVNDGDIQIAPQACLKTEEQGSLIGTDDGGEIIVGNTSDDLTVKAMTDVKINIGASNIVKVDTNGLSATSIYASDSILSNGEITAYSDRRLKSDIKDLNNRGLLSPKTYIKDNKEQIGFIAQDVEELYPELVLEDTKGYKTLNYMQLTAVLSAQINELTKQVAELTQKVKELESK